MNYVVNLMNAVEQKFEGHEQLEDLKYLASSLAAGASVAFAGRDPFREQDRFRARCESAELEDADVEAVTLLFDEWAKDSIGEFVAGFEPESVG